jgi:thioredoxin-related protein
MPLIAKIYRETKDQGLLLFGVETKAAREKFKVRGIPTLVLINKSGEIAEHQVGSGPETEKALRAALRSLGVKIL